MNGFGSNDAGYQLFMTVHSALISAPVFLWWPFLQTLLKEAVQTFKAFTADLEHLASRLIRPWVKT